MRQKPGHFDADNPLFHDYSEFFRKNREREAESLQKLLAIKNTDEEKRAEAIQKKACGSVLQIESGENLTVREKSKKF